MTVTAAVVNAVLGIPTPTLRAWVRRGKVRRHGHDAYDQDDVIREFHRWAKRTQPDPDEAEADDSNAA